MHPIAEKGYLLGNSVSDSKLSLALVRLNFVRRDLKEKKLL